MNEEAVRLYRENGVETRLAEAADGQVAISAMMFGDVVSRAERRKSYAVPKPGTGTVHVPREEVSNVLVRRQEAMELLGIFEHDVVDRHVDGTGVVMHKDVGVIFRFLGQLAIEPSQSLAA